MEWTTALVRGIDESLCRVFLEFVLEGPLDLHWEVAVDPFLVKVVDGEVLAFLHHGDEVLVIPDFRTIPTCLIKPKALGTG